ncbi:MAG: hypothetical protein N2Z22_10075 [Turneriella sp.]|nr:hypothetical protein [Turneriella sp.]
MYFLRFILRRIFLIFFIARKHFWRNALSSLGLFLSLLIAITILGVLEPVKKMLRAKMESSLPAQTLRLVPEFSATKTAGWSQFRRERDVLMPITQDLLLRARRWGKPGAVRSVSATQLLQQPAIGRFEDPLLAQLGFSFDLVLQGVPAKFFRPAMRCNLPYLGRTTQDKGKILEEIPIIVPENYLEIAYSYALISGLPTVSPQRLIGLQLRAILGQSITGVRWSFTEEVRLVVCGFAAPGLISAVGVPIEWVQKKHRLRQQKNALQSYDQLFIEVSNEKAIPEILAAARAAKLRLPEKTRSLEPVLKSLERLDWIFLAVAAILATLAAIALANSFALLAVQNRYEFGLYLVFGSSLFFLWFLLAFEGAVWGFFHSWLALQLADPFLHFLEQYLKELPWLSKFSATGLEQLKLELSAGDRLLIYLLSVSLAALSSLLPGAIVLGRRTLALVKKD